MITKSPRVRKHHEYLQYVIFCSKLVYTFLQLVSSSLRGQEIRLSSTDLLQPTGIYKQTIFSPATPSLVRETIACRNRAIATGFGLYLSFSSMSSFNCNITCSTSSSWTEVIVKVQKGWINISEEQSNEAIHRIIKAIRRILTFTFMCIDQFDFDKYHPHKSGDLQILKSRT